ncbi:MAG: bifunctional DNA-formamidopyrimidine glycosylase/DNA-(apurinic or apyrimidinic site) lyase [Phycisphaeraceae bacterium]
MPELPEVECVRRSLKRLVVGRRIGAVRVIRSGVIRGEKTNDGLLVGDRVERVVRHGKQLAIVGRAGGCVCVHLGMSGQLCVLPRPDERDTKPTPLQRSNTPAGSTHAAATPWPNALPAHTHVVWLLDGGLALRFTDPRRFGGLWTFAHFDALWAERWSRLGPDALTITPAGLHRRLSGTRRGLKAALLDQALVAGLGNIYVDELLFGARLHPMTPADAIDRAVATSLVGRARTLLRGAVARGGSSLRDYVDAQSRSGSQQLRHRVYGRAGLRCKRRACRGVIRSGQVAGRTTAWCPNCQPGPEPDANNRDTYPQSARTPKR